MYTSTVSLVAASRLPLVAVFSFILSPKVSVAVILTLTVALTLTLVLTLTPLR